jgi:hypothetical protein
MTITLTREEAQQVLDALEKISMGGHPDWANDVTPILRTRLAQPEPEPVADKYLMEVECTKCGAKQDGVLTVTAPPQREWQGLTDEEKQTAYAMFITMSAIGFVQAIEAKLKEKNT